MPIYTTIQPCIHCGTRTTTHHSECPYPLQRTLEDSDAYEARINAYANLEFRHPDIAGFAHWTVTSFGTDGELTEETVLAPEAPIPGQLYGVDRTTDPQRLAGQRVGATVESTTEVLRRMYPQGRSIDFVYPHSSMQDYAERRSERRYEELYGEATDGIRLSGLRAEIQDSTLVPTGTPPHLLAHEEARILRAMHAKQK